MKGWEVLDLLFSNQVFSHVLRTPNNDAMGYNKEEKITTGNPLRYG